VSELRRMAVRDERPHGLPSSLAPRGLSRTEAAAYIGVSPSLFDALVKDGRMPGPKTINSRVVWDRLKLDEAFSALPDRDGEEPDNPWDKVMGLAG
jgi:predicted DNA-binding transcriptional regulator AlpA